MSRADPSGVPGGLTLLLQPDEIAARVADLASRLAPKLDDDAVAVCLLLGGLWFAADLTRALAAAGRFVAFDGLWLASYGDEKVSSGRPEALAGPQRSLAGHQALILDDVIDSGHSLATAAQKVREAGARSVITAVFARKPWPRPRAIEPDEIAWEAPGRFLVGYGMDMAGGLRGLPFVAAAD